MRINLSAILIIFLIMFGFSGCSEEIAVEDKLPLVKTQRVGETNINSESMYSGTVKGRYETNLAFQVGGQILSRNVEIGDFVKAGDVLMVINPRDVVQQTNQAEAQVASAKAQLDLATSNLNRYTELFKEGAVSASVLDQYQTSYASAAAAYDNAVATAAQSQNSLGYTNLIAEADGVISAINVEVGQVVAAGQTAASLVQVGELEVAIDIPESKIAEIVINQPVTVAFWAINNEVSGYVREIAPIADASSRTFTVKISIPNPPSQMQLGMTASVAVSSDSAAKNEMTIPLGAVYQVGEKSQVWIVEDGKTKLKDVEIKDFDGNEVLVNGLKSGDIVATAGIHKLREGQSVRIE